jgi:hypothetical protein
MAVCLLENLPRRSKNHGAAAQPQPSMSLNFKAIDGSLLFGVGFGCTAAVAHVKCQLLVR